jgi:hypothetical protein
MSINAPIKYVVFKISKQPYALSANIVKNFISTLVIIPLPNAHDVIPCASKF